MISIFRRREESNFDFRMRLHMTWQIVCVPRIAVFQARSSKFEHSEPASQNRQECSRLVRSSELNFWMPNEPLSLSSTEELRALLKMQRLSWAAKKQSDQQEAPKLLGRFAFKGSWPELLERSGFRSAMKSHNFQS